MFKKISFVALLSLFCAMSVAAQNGGALPEFNKIDGGFPSLKIQADDLAKATVKGDYDRLAALTHDEVIKASGGRKKLVESLKVEVAGMKAQGYQIVSITTGEVKQIERVGKEIFAVVMLEMVSDTPTGKVKGGTSLVGVSDDNGANWTFLNGFDSERFKQMFPKADKIVIPPDTALEPVTND